MTKTQRFSDFFVRWSGLVEELVERDGYLFYESRRAGQDRWIWIFSPILATAGFAFAWFAREETFAVWFGIIFGLMSGVVIPVIVWLGREHKSYSRMIVEDGILKWEIDWYMYGKDEGQLELTKHSDVYVEMDHEGETNRITFVKEDGEEVTLPIYLSKQVMGRCRKPFVKVVKFYQPSLFEALKALYNCKPQGLT